MGGSVLENEWTTDFIDDMVDTYSNYVNTNLLQASTGNTLTGPYDFGNLTLGECIKRLASYDGYSFYVDENDELRYFKPSNVTYISVTETDIVDYSPFSTTDYNLYNKVIVKGYGDISVTKTDTDSVATYGPYIKVISNPSIREETDATKIADSFLNKYKDPALAGRVTILGDTSVTLQKGVALDVDYINISGIHNILGYTHKLDKDGFYTEIEFGTDEFDINSDLSNLQTNVEMAVESINEGVPGVDKYIIFNDSGEYGTDSSFQYNKTTDVLSAGNITTPGYLTTTSYIDSDDYIKGDTYISCNAAIIGDYGQFNSVSSQTFNIAPQKSGTRFCKSGLAGNFWVSGSGTFCQLYMCTSNWGTWHKVTIA